MVPGRKVLWPLIWSMLALLLFGGPTTASVGWQTRAGTIGHALTLQDGSHVYLDAVEIQKIRASQTPPYFVIAECFSPRDRISVLTEPSPLLRMGQTVDVEGDLTTLDSGERALTNVTVLGYTDKDGNLLYHGPLIKGLDAPTPWDYKIDLTVSRLSRSVSSPESLPPGEVTTSSSTQVVYCSTLAGAKSQALGTVVEIRCHPVSSGGTGSFVLGEDGNSNTLTVNYTGTVNQTSRVCTVTGTIDTNGTDPVLDVDSGPNFNVQESFQGSVLTAAQGTLAWSKSWADGHTFASGDITGKIITRNWTDYLYIEDDTRACGIRVEKTAHGHVRGEMVSVEGTLATNSNGERYIAATTITQTGTGELNPLGLNNKWLGGGDFAYVAGPPASGQRGVTDVPGVPSTPAYGLNNIGLLVRVWGKVTELDTANPAQWFMISDGSNVQTKVAYPPFTYALDNYVTLSGISSCEVDANGDLQRVLRPQPLICTITQAQGQNDPTNASPVNFTVTFSESVYGFTADDVTVTGVEGATKTVTGSGAIYNVTVSLPTAGTLVAIVPAGGAEDASGVLNHAATYTDNSVLFDNVAPTISTCTETPAVSSGQVTINYTGAVDTGGSGLLAVGLYEVASGQYTLLDARTGSSNSFTLSYTGNGTVNNLVLIAFDNAGNISDDKPVPTFTIDQAAPSQPTNVVMSHVLPTSTYIHATWNASTDLNGIRNYSYQFWYVDGTGMYGLSNVLTTTSTYATYYTGYLPLDAKTYGIRVYATDNAGNVSNYTDSAGVTCNKVKVGFLYYKCETGTAYTYSNFKWYIDSYLNSVKYYGPCVGNVTYTTISSAPSTTNDYASYDVLFVALPASNFTSTEIGAIQSFVNNQGFNKRLVLVGEYGKTSLGNGYSAYNTRLNTLISTQNLSLTTRFHADESTQNSYPYEQGISYRDCPVRSHYLTNGVGGLWDAGPSTFAAYVHPIAALRDGENAYPGQFWVVEEDIPQGCSIVCIHDCGMFLFEYDNYLQAYPNKNLVGNYETDYDDVPDRNFRFVENLYTVFPH